MTTTASLEQSLQAVESQLPKLEKAAEAEIAFMLYNSAESNPWAGGCKRRDDLRQGSGICDCKSRRSKRIFGTQLRTALRAIDC